MRRVFALVFFGVLASASGCSGCRDDSGRNHDEVDGDGDGAAPVDSASQADFIAGGGDAGSDLGRTGDLGDGADAGAKPDLSPATITTIAPVWHKRVDGVSYSTGDFARELSTGEIGWLLNQGYGSPEVVYGVGEPNETSIAAPMKATLAWLDGSNGELVRVRQIVGDHPSTTGAAFCHIGFVETARGELTVAGEYGGGVVFNPGTDAALTIIGERKDNPTEASYAIDPFVARYTANGEPKWLVLGDTPGPIAKTWFNQQRGLVALDDESVLFDGMVDGSGFKLGGVAVPESGGGYLAKLGGDGAVAIASTRHDDSGAIMPTLRPYRASDGAIVWIGLLPEDRTLTLRTDTASPLVLSAESNAKITFVVVKMTSTGETKWVRRISSDGSFYLYNSFLRHNDELVLTGGGGNGTVVIKDEALNPVGAAVDVKMGVALALDAAGGLAWSRAHENEDAFYGSVVETSAGELWMHASFRWASTVVPLEGAAAMMLPSRPEPVGEARNFNVLYRLSDTGERTAARHIGFDLDGELSATHDGGLLLTTIVLSTQRPAIFDGTGALTELPRCTVPWDACSLLTRLPAP